jgi:hypothetical protein
MEETWDRDHHISSITLAGIPFTLVTPSVAAEITIIALLRWENCLKFECFYSKNDLTTLIPNWGMDYI